MDIKVYHVSKIEEREEAEYIIHHLVDERVYRLYTSTIESWSEPDQLLLEIYDSGDGWVLNTHNLDKDKKSNKLSIDYASAEQLVLLTNFINRSYNNNKPVFKIIEQNPVYIMSI